MKIAIISDVHGNLEALEAVLQDAAGQGVEIIYSLGDMVGYGPDPQPVVDLLARRGVPSVMGNHELALCEPEMLAWFNPSARRSLEQTRELLDQGAPERFRDLPRFLTAHGCRFVHGFPPDSPTVYLFEPEEAEVIQVMSRLPEPLCFVGHTHDLELLALTRGSLCRQPLGRRPIFLDPDSRHLVNVGSVGQPRDGDNQAKYVIWEPAERRLTLRPVRYDVDAVVRKILERGLPEVNAKRLL
ncbi:MAG: metallophosphatase family protein [Deltaproteobacteria bacterium]|nr:metallophosphatase family protein [Deltaproteobacteria bacterium]